MIPLFILFLNVALLVSSQEKHTMRQKFWELGGTRMGDAVGIKEEKPADADGAAETQAENADGVSHDVILSQNMVDII